MVRLGKPLKKSRAWPKAGVKGKPGHVTAETVVGQVSADLISTFFAPQLQDMAAESLQKYANDLLDHEDALRNIGNSADAEISVDGSIQTDDEIPLPPRVPFFHSQYRVDELTSLLTETSDYFFAKQGGWKVHANAAKFERNLDEKYGIFRPFITEHPEVEQFIRSMQRKMAMGYFSPLRQGPPPIPRTTAVVLLFMMQRGKMQWQILVLATLFFLVGLQPWALVAIVGLVQWLLNRRRGKTVGKMQRRIAAVDPYFRKGNRQEQSEEAERKQKEEMLSRPVGFPLGAKEQLDTTEFDTIMIGSGPGTLYAAALLSRAGRKVLVLSAASDASGCLTLRDIKDAKLKQKLGRIPFDVETCNIAKISQQQRILAPALATNSDCQGGIRFAKIGSDADGYAFEILSIPGVGTESADSQVPFILKAYGGVASLMEDAAMYLGDNWPDSNGNPGDSLTGQYVTACNKMNSSASQYYLSKVLPDSVNKIRAEAEYQSASLRNSTTLLNSCFPLNAHLRSLMAGIGMKGENIKPSQTCMAAHITNLCSAMSEEGMHYPIGGPRALCHALANSIEQSGGRVVTGAQVGELLFDESLETPKIKTKKDDDEPAAPWCVGVHIAGGREVRFDSDRYSADVASSPVVVSMEGFIQTFIRFLPDDIRSKYKVPRGVPALSERRPVMHFLFALQGTASDLSVTGADYYRLPGATIARDQVDESTGGVAYGDIGWADDDDGGSGEAEASDIVESTNQESMPDKNSKGSGEIRRKKKRQSKFESGSSWIHISFPSAKDPSFEERHGNITTCVVTIEADDELVQLYDTKPKIFIIKKPTAASAGELQRLSERVKKDLFDIYPQLEGKIEHAEIRGPFAKGLSHNPERYAAKGIRADTPYPGLFAGGSDLTVGDSFSGATVGGWLVANAVCGYSALDHMFLQKNITTDLEQFLEPPSLFEDDDIAVPYTLPPPPPPSKEEFDALYKDDY